MPIVEHAVIAAAGLGSRLGLGRPKCLLEIEGISLIQAQLALLKDVPDVRVVVGFEEHAVIKEARAHRPDAIFVRNPAFRSTTTLQSYAMGAKGLESPCLFMDADIWFEPKSFTQFLDACALSTPILAVTEAKTVDAVYAHLENEQVVRFSRTEPAPYEWANLSWLPPAYCEVGEGAVFERMERDLPIAARKIISYEVDRETDLESARESIAKHV
ncbi:2-C-methyl-D-erythritol 4-phosphate cytidylyltransferase [compost metagenome]